MTRRGERTFFFLSFPFVPSEKKSKVSHRAWSSEAPLRLHVCHSAPVSLQVGSFADHLLRINFGCSTQGFCASHAQTLSTWPQRQPSARCLVCWRPAEQTFTLIILLVSDGRCLSGCRLNAKLDVLRTFEPDGWLSFVVLLTCPHQRAQFLFCFFHFDVTIIDFSLCLDRPPKKISDNLRFYCWNDLLAS